MLFFQTILLRLKPAAQTRFLDMNFRRTLVLWRSAENEAVWKNLQVRFLTVFSLHPSSWSTTAFPWRRSTCCWGNIDTNRLRRRRAAGPLREPLLLRALQRSERSDSIPSFIKAAAAAICLTWAFYCCSSCRPRPTSCPLPPSSAPCSSSLSSSPPQTAGRYQHPTLLSSAVLQYGGWEGQTTFTLPRTRTN